MRDKLDRQDNDLDIQSLQCAPSEGSWQDHHLRLHPREERSQQGDVLFRILRPY